MKTLSINFLSNRLLTFIISLIAIQTHSQTLIYDNGPIYNVESPKHLSLVQDETLNFSAYGFNTSREGGYRLLDEFFLEKETIIDYLLLYAYQQNETEPSITAAYVQIWKGNPYYEGELIWGDMTTNVLTSVEITDGLRTTESMPNDESRLIQEIIVNTPDLIVDAGEYWIDYSLEGIGESGPWSPPITITGVTHTGNAMQYNGWAYTAVIDIGVNEFQGIPFKVFGKTKPKLPINVCHNCLVKNSKNETLKFYPNPTTDFLNIESDISILNIDIFDMNGRKMNVIFHQTDNRIDLTRLIPGNYNLLIHFEDGKTVHQMIVKR